MGRWTACCVVAAGVLTACTGGDGGSTASSAPPSAAAAPDDTTAPPDPTAPDPTAPDPTLLVGAASESVLPTVGGDRSYLSDATGWDGSVDPQDPGVFVPAFDQGRIDVGNGNSDAAWVHDDLRASAIALEHGSELTIIASVDVYMIFAADAAEIERRARTLLPAEVADSAHIVIAATHVHHGPDTAFSVNDDWYSLMADQTAAAIAGAYEALQPATMSVATGEHRFGMADVRDPLIVDPALHVVGFHDAAGRTIATIVQWTSHPETTLGFVPFIDLTTACATKGWTGDDCTAEDRYLSADYPGVLRTRLQAAEGGEVVYFNGALGSQIGPGAADVWMVDADHPVGDGITAPAGAQPLPGAADFRQRNFARTEAIGSQLAIAVEGLLATASDDPVPAIEWREQSFYTRLTNIGFRVLLADGDLGWQDPMAFLCGSKPFDDQFCHSDEARSEDDPVLTPLTGSQVRVGDVLRSQIIHVALGDVGLLFLPGELPPELVVGLPADFDTDAAAYTGEPGLHATGSDYELPGRLLDLVPDRTTVVVGLGGDELGYFVPLSDVRLKCLDVVLADGVTCQQLFDEGVLVTPDAISGVVCHAITDDPAQLAPYRPKIAAAVAATCRYGQALGRELGEPDGHYEETNSAGWDMVDDLWVAAEQLFGAAPAG